MRLLLAVLLSANAIGPRRTAGWVLVGLLAGFAWLLFMFFCAQRV